MAKVKARITDGEVRCGRFGCGRFLGQLDRDHFDPGAGWTYAGGRYELVNDEERLVGGQWQATKHAVRGWKHAHQIVSEGLGTAQELERYGERLKVGPNAFARPEPLEVTDQEGDPRPSEGRLNRAEASQLPASITCYVCGDVNEVHAT